MRISDSLEIGCDFWTLHPACYNALVVQVAWVERTGNDELANPTLWTSPARRKGLYRFKAAWALPFNRKRKLWHEPCKWDKQRLLQERSLKHNKSNVSQITLMNTLEMKGNWNIVKGKLKQKWARLTDDDLEFVEGKENELIGRIQKRTGEAREDVEEAIDAACCSCSSHK